MSDEGFAGDALRFDLCGVYIQGLCREEARASRFETFETFETHKNSGTKRLKEDASH